jgi:tetratricopeptide (TPR) repeat protein
VSGTPRPPWRRTGGGRANQRWLWRAFWTGVAGITVGGLSQVYGDLVSDQVLNPAVKRFVGIPATALMVVALVALAGRWWFRLRAAPDPEAPPPTPPTEVPGPPSLRWDPPDGMLFGRDEEMRAAVRRVRTHGVVAVVGPRDIGTSAIAAEVVRRLPVDPNADGLPARYRLDLRGRSSEAPEEVRAVATRLLGAFGLDEPARDDAESLADAARRLLDRLRGRRTVLLLDEVARPEQVDWLVDRLGGAGETAVVIAGEQAAADAVRSDEVVHVGPLPPADGRRMLLTELGRSPDETLDDAEAGAVGQLVAACLGRPRAIRDIATELTSAQRDWTLAELAAAVESTGVAGGPVFRIRVAMLARIRHSLSPAANQLMLALAGLPVTELPPAALAVLVVVPAGADPLRELTERDLVRFVPPGRYRMPQEVRLAVLHGAGGSAGRRSGGPQGALNRLVRHYAELAERWAVGLGAPETSPAAVSWFRAEEAMLLELVRHAEDPRSLGAVCRIADALEAWHSREQRAADLLATADALRDAAHRAADPTVEALAVVRRSVALRMAGRLAEAEADARSVTADEHRVPAIAARGHLALALANVAQAVGWRDEDGPLADARRPAERSGGQEDLAAQEALAEAERALHRCLGLLPRADVAAHIAARIDLGVVRLRQGYPVRAVEHLAHAEQLATETENWSARAHAVELLGVVSWRRGRSPEAISRWRQALELYRELGEDQGVARCLLHLGTVAVTEPAVAGLVQGSAVRELTPAAGAEVAVPLLTESLRLRAGQPADAQGTRLARRYLDLAQQRMRPPV